MIFLSNLTPSWPPKSKKINEKSMPRCLPKLSWIFDRFVIDLWSMFLPTSTCATFQIIVFPMEKRSFFMKSLFEVLSMLNFILMPTWNHLASQNPLKIHENLDPKRFPIMHPFSLLFWTPNTSLLGPNLEPSWLSVSLQDGPRGFPDSSRCAPELLPEGTQDGSQDEVIVKTRQDGFKVYFWWFFD